MDKQVIKKLPHIQLLLWTTLLLFLLLLITTGNLLWQNYYNYMIIPKYEEKLWNITLKKSTEINSYLNEQEAHATALAQMPQITKAFDTFSPTTKEKNDSFLKEFSLFISSQQETMAFKNCLLVDQQGTILFSTKESITKENITKNSHQNSALGESFQRAVMTLTNDFSEFAFSELLDQPALFVSIPLFKEKKFIGVLIYQLDEKKIYAMTNQYIGLEKTGEIALAKEKNSYILFVAPTRHDPDLAFKKRSIFSNVSISIQKSVLGEQGTGMATDYRGKQVVAAWTFIPRVDWGMVVKIDQDEIKYPLTNQYKILFILIISFLLLLCMFIELSQRRLIPYAISFHGRHIFSKIPKQINHPFFFILLFFLCLSLKNIFHSERAATTMIEDAKNTAIKDINNGAEKIEKILTKISFIALSMSDDLRTERLTKDDIKIRMKRDLIENDNFVSITIAFAPHAYDKTKKLYAPSIMKKDDSFAETMIEDSYDYTDKTIGAIKTAWYTQAIEHKEAWLKPYKDPENKNFLGIYSRAFYDKKHQPLGVISINYKLNNIITIADDITIGQTGYAFLMSNTGDLIFYPMSETNPDQKTLAHLAQEKGNAELAALAEKSLLSKPLFSSFLSEKTNRLMFIYTKPLTINDWIFGTIFSEDEIGLESLTIRHYYFWIIFYTVMTLLSLLTFLYNINVLSYTGSFVLVNSILALALLYSWHIIQITSVIDRKTETVITDQMSLDKFIDMLNDEAKRKHETAPITIPCGILLYSLNLPDPDHVIISGYLWNKYNIESHKKVSHGIQIPQATALKLGKPLTSIEDGWETVTWNIKGTIFQEQNYAPFPFDKQHIKLILEHQNIEESIILTPDLASYKKLSPEATPGLDREFNLSGFVIDQTFFDYHAVEPNTNFGFKDYGKVTDHFQLIYNIIISRNLLSPFVLYFIPLLVILFSLFSTLLISERKTDPFAVLGPYTGLFFALIVLHRSLREEHPTGTTLYMEYGFFYTYITIILLVIHAVLVHYYLNWEYYQKKVFPIVKVLFWPFQLVSWLITTLIVFY